MLDTPHTQPAALGLARASTVPSQLGIEAVDLEFELALLSDGRSIPIVAWLDWYGDECRFRDDELYAFVAGSDDTGWWCKFFYEFDFAGQLH